MEDPVMRVYIDKKSCIKQLEIEVNLLLHVVRNQPLWGKVERGLRTELGSILNMLKFGDEDRHIATSRSHRSQPTYHDNYHAYSGKIKVRELRGIVKYCEKSGIEVKYGIPEVKFPLPFQHD